MRRDVRIVNDRHDDAGVGHFRRVTAVATDDPDVFGVKLTWGDTLDLPAHTDGGAIERNLVTVSYLSRITAEPRARSARRT